jgi:enoyl-CoA hydratase/carnithine racemase
MPASLIINTEERVLRLTLDRPDKRNALSSAICASIVEAIENAQDDPSIGAVLIDANGEVFSAGMDLDEATSSSASDLTAIHERLFTIGSWSRKPIVAAIQGPALGGGVGLICNAHVAIAAHGSSFGLTEIRIGMWPFVIYRAVATALGERRALELSLMGRIFNVPEALQWGLVHEATPVVELDDRATAVAMHLAQSSPEAIRLGLAFVQQTLGQDPLTAAPIAANLRKHVFASTDFKEGVAAFREKRRPRFITPTPGT